MGGFRKLALAATIATYFLIFMGGLVRVSGAGLGCPDWPTCFGRWFPPTSVSQLPPDIDPAKFNFALAWIEYVNRLCGVTLGFLIAATGFWAIFRFRRNPHILIPSVLAALLVAYQGWQGSQVVSSQLKPLIVSIHMGLAFVIASLMIYVTQQAWYLEKPDVTEKTSGIHLPWYAIALAAIAIVQVIIGTQVRSDLEQVADAFPLLPQREWMGKVGGVSVFHTLLGVIVTLATWQVGAKIVRQAKEALTTQAAWGAMILAAAQVLIGAILTLAGVPGVLRLFHLLISSLYVGMMVMLFSALRREGKTV
jgi:heme a synthase